MKRNSILILVIALFSLQSCLKDDCASTVTYLGYEPVFKTKAEIQDEIVFVPERTLENPGKFYYYNSMILISERDEGIHIIDNSDLKKPKKLGFIAIPGNQDISLSDHYIYADTRYNIVVIDIANVEEPRIVTFIENVKDVYFEPGIEGRILVNFIETDIVEEVDCGNNPDRFFWGPQRNILFADLALDVMSAGSAIPEFDNSGIAGSLSRMALFNEHFYYINDYRMDVFDVANLEDPKLLNQIHLEWGVETIFPYKDNLFIGANNGMHIYDNSDPGKPEYLSTFAHANACDPVAVQGDYAYVTLRDGNECQNFINQLDVVDIKDLLRPQLLASFPMHNPHGLSVRGDILYLCEADEGMKVFNVSDPEVIHENLIAHVKDYFAYDVISVSPNLLLMIGEDGFYQFDTSDPTDPKVLSAIHVGQ